MAAMRTKKFWIKLPSKVRGLLTRQRERYTSSVKGVWTEAWEVLAAMRAVPSALYEGVAFLLPYSVRARVERVGSACLACVCAPVSLVRQRMRSRSRGSTTASSRGSDHDKLIAGGGKPWVNRGPSAGILVPHGEEDDNGLSQATTAVMSARQLPGGLSSKFRLSLPASRKTRNTGLLAEHATSGAGQSNKSARLTDDGGGSGSSPGSSSKRRILGMLLPYKDASLPKPPSSDKAGQTKGRIMQEQI